MALEICKTCQYIFDTIGQGHSEAVYQKALVLELYNKGAHSVEYEKHVPVYFADSNNITHTIGSERIDIIARTGDEIILIELKAVQKLDNFNCMIQIRKYLRSLVVLDIQVTRSYAINFPQRSNITEIEYLII
jgi:GxxExxY protein